MLPVDNQSPIRNNLENINKQTEKDDITNSNSKNLTLFTLHNLFDKNKQKLPLINLTFGDKNFTFLVDSGASVSLLPKTTFEQIKDVVKVTYLSRKVNITTLNSTLEFSACTQISFKINNTHFRHQFYVTNCDSFNFHGILGFDFMSKYNLNIDTKANQFVFDSFNTPFVDSECNQTSQLTISHVYLSKKVIIDPHESAFVKVFTKSHDFDNQEVLFSPKTAKNDLILQETINKVERSKFSVIIHNNGSQPIHLNKNYQLGSITQDFSFHDQSVLDVNNSHDKNILNQDNEICNYIQATPEMLEKRKNELSINDFKLDNLTESQKHTLANILLKNYACFSKTMSTLGCTDLVVPSIKLRNPNPIRTLPYDIPQALQDVVKNELEELMAANIIERHVSNWASPLVLVKKKATDPNKPVKYRLALDLRLLNSVIENSSYPLPKISTLINNISQFKYFSSLDFKQAYFQLKLPEELQDIITFTTPFGSFCNKRLPFGLKTSAGTFQALVDKIIDELKSLNVDHVYAYQDDFIICANDFQEMIAKVEAVLKILSKYNMTLTPDKCRFFQEEIDYLGFHISHKTISPVEFNIAKINKFSPPKTPKQVKRFLGLCGFYRSIIPNFAELTGILNELTQKNKKFVWNDEHQTAFEKLQDIFFSKPFVTLPDWNKKFFLNTDASKNAVSAVLLQEHEGKFHPVAYFSKSLNKAEKNYPAIKLELMAIFKGVMAFKHYLFNRKFTILSDSKPLKFYKKSTSPADLTTRWLLALSEFSYDFVYLPGKDNVLSDYFSRCQNPDFRQNCDINELADENPQSIILPFVEPKEWVCATQADPESEISTETFKHEQTLDLEICDIISQLNNNSKVNNKFVDKFFVSPTNGLLMYHKEWAKNKFADLIVVPKSLKYKVLKIAHGSHTGVNKTYEILGSRFYWKGIYSDTVNYVLSCDPCIRAKPYSAKPAPLKNTFLPHRPGEFISIDIVGPLKDTGYILTVVDHFSKHVVLYHLQNLTANTMVKHLLNYFSLFGRVSMILSDLGTQFNSEIFHTINSELGIKVIHTTSGHPQHNSVSERLNLAIKSSINTLREQGISIQSALLIHQQVYNSTVHPSTGFTPNLIQFGRELGLYFDTFQNNHDVLQLIDHSFYAKQVLSDLNKYFETAFDSLKLHQADQNSKFAQNAKLRCFEKGNTVYLKSKDAFNPRYTGPYTVVDKHSDVNVSIRILSDEFAKPFKVHVNRLRLARERRPFLISPPVNDRKPPLQKTRYFLRSRNAVI